MRWKFSHLKNTSAPSSSFSVREVITGVRWAWPSIRLAAATTSSKVGRVMGRSMRRRKQKRHRERWRVWLKRRAESDAPFVLSRAGIDLDLVAGVAKQRNAQNKAGCGVGGLEYLARRVAANSR